MNQLDLTKLYSVQNSPRLLQSCETISGEGGFFLKKSGLPLGFAENASNVEGVVLEMARENQSLCTLYAEKLWRGENNPSQKTLAKFG